LLRPTLREFNEFVSLLDKLMSGNMNKDFFRGEVSAETQEERSDGKFVIRQKGTIALLKEWVASVFRTDQQEMIEEMISTFRKVREMRQRPAHAIDENKFDHSYFHKQRELMIDAYQAMSTLRQVLGCHPDASGFQLPGYMERSEIWTR
jgi:hypothetical protein